jgi:DNA-binding transcriptional MerR regulator
VKIDVVNIEQLCDEVNRVLQARRITVADARASSVVSPRNVRYYRTIGLLTPPSRSEGRAEYEQDHIDQIVAIKRAQQDGMGLEELIKEQKAVKARVELLGQDLHVNYMRAEVNPINALEIDFISRVPRSAAQYPESDELLGWSVHFESVVLSGHGARPTRKQIEAIRRILDSPDMNE